MCWALISFVVFQECTGEIVGDSCHNTGNTKTYKCVSSFQCLLFSFLEWFTELSPLLQFATSILFLCFAVLLFSFISYFPLHE